MQTLTLEQKLSLVGKVFRIRGELSATEVLTSGNVNSTYKLEYLREDGTRKSYVAQRINPYVFRHPAEIMKNIDLVTTHIRQKSEHGRVSLHFHHTDEGLNYFVDQEDGSFWRLYTFIPAICYNTCDDLVALHRAGEAFGEFQMQLSDFDASLLFETIPDFHNTKKRLETLFNDVADDPCCRAAEVKEELAYIASVKDLASRLSEMQAAGEIPLRVTHNDTKINNVLFDKETGDPLVVIDLDTVMPGLAVHDFGDAVRFAASTAQEDEVDLSRVALDLGKYRAFAEGFIMRTKDALTKIEIETMALGAFTITIELASRFLDDYLLGDKYFKITHKSHNLDRARCQIALAKDMLAKYDKMCNIVHDIARKKTKE